MNQRKFVILSLLILGTCLSFSGLSCAHAAESAPKERKPIIGLGLHQFFNTNHPYNSKTWTLEEWRGYLTALKRLGYNMIMFTPFIDAMPDPLTPSDQTYLDRIARVIDIVHDELDMRLYFMLTPNVEVISEEAAKADFASRHYKHATRPVDPEDAEKVAQMMRRREDLFRHWTKMDGILLIDSDPGSYPGAKVPSFIRLYFLHREMLNRLRPEIELVYWMHAGWESQGRYYKTGSLPSYGTMKEYDEFRPVLEALKQRNPEPWGLAGYPPLDYMKMAQMQGLESRMLALSFGYIEPDGTPPITNFCGHYAYAGGAARYPRGVVGHLQRPCLQAPNTFAFARGAQGRPISPADYVQLANDLAPGHGEIIVKAWEMIGGDPAWGDVKPLPTATPAEANQLADQLEKLAGQNLPAGPLAGLIMGDVPRFIGDLALQLRWVAAYEVFCTASEKGEPIREPFEKFVTASRTWLQHTGYQFIWRWPRMLTALKKLHSPAINAVRRPQVNNEGLTPFEIEQRDYRRLETETVELLKAFKITVEEMKMKNQ